MWQFVMGFGMGLYIGTYYECRPCLNKLGEWLKTQLPPKK